MRPLSYFISISLFLIIPLLAYSQEKKEFDKSEIKKILLGEWERLAEGYEKTTCKKADRFILSLNDSNKEFKADGYIDYFTYLSTDKKKSICYLEHPSYSFVFFDIMDNDTSIYLQITGYLWSANWNIKIINDKEIVLNNKTYKRCQLIKTNSWYTYNYLNYKDHKKIDRFIKKHNKKKNAGRLDTLQNE